MFSANVQWVNCEQHSERGELRVPLDVISIATAGCREMAIELSKGEVRGIVYHEWMTLPCDQVNES
jgi:hypothetical protein